MQTEYDRLQDLKKQGDDVVIAAALKERWPEFLDALAELAVGNWRGTGTDIGNCQARGTDDKDGPLIVWPDDKGHKHDPFILVVTKDAPTVYIAGWLYGYECMRDEFWRGDSWSVPQDRLRAIGSLPKETHSRFIFQDHEVDVYQDGHCVISKDGKVLSEQPAPSDVEKAMIVALTTHRRLHRDDVSPAERALDVRKTAEWLREHGITAETLEDLMTSGQLPAPGIHALIDPGPEFWEWLPGFFDALLIAAKNLDLK